VTAQALDAAEWGRETFEGVRAATDPLDPAEFIATWEREVHEGDPTSAVLVRALAEGVVDRTI